MSFPRGRGKVFRNLPLSDEAMPVPPIRGHSGIGAIEEEIYGKTGDSGAGEAVLEGGRQIDPSLVARSKIQGLEKEIESFRAREKDLLAELDVLKSQRQSERKVLGEEREALRIEAEREAKRLGEQAREEGLKQGHKEGMVRGEAQVESRVRQEYQFRFSQMLDLLGSVREGLENDLEALVDRNGPMLVRLWQAMLERFLRREVELDDETALRVFREVAGRISDRTKIRVFLNPKDRDLCSAREKDFSEIKRVAEQFDLIADESIERGGCLVETNLGVYDARWRSQLEAVDREIEELFQEGRFDDDSAG